MSDMRYQLVTGSDTRFESLVVDIYVPTRFEGKLVASVRRSDNDECYLVELHGPYVPDIYIAEVEFSLLISALEGARRKLEDG